MRKLLLLLSVLVVIALITPNPIMADKTVRFKTGPIRNEADARRICEAHVETMLGTYAGHNVTWNGAWRTEDNIGNCYYNVED
jgi:hypothetical protein